MAKTPKQGTQAETSVQGKAPSGTSFADLIKSATGSGAPTKESFQSAMAARGYRSSDVRKLTKAFDQVTKSGNEYYLQDEGFDVYNGGQQSGSGRAKGNKAGADIGDLIGLGNNVSLLAGALRNEKASHDRRQQSLSAQVSPEDAMVSPQNTFAQTMADLIKVSGSKAPEAKDKPLAKKSTAGSGKKSNTPLTFMDALKTPPLGVNAEAEMSDEGPISNIGYTPQLSDNTPDTREGKISAANKRRQFINEDGSFNPNSLNPSNLFDPYAWASATENVKDITKTGGSAFGTMGLFSSNPTIGKVYNHVMLPFQLMAMGSDMVADAFTDEGVSNSDTIQDAVQVAGNTIGANSPAIKGALKGGATKVASTVKGAASKVKVPSASSVVDKVKSLKDLVKKAPATVKP